MTFQVESNHYLLNYDTKERFCSYWYQANEIVSLSPDSVLEIGIGNSFLSNYLRRQSLNVTSLDLDKRLKPDVASSVLNIPFSDKRFDIVASYEVLEHLPYQSFKKALLEMSRVSRMFILISLPDVSLCYPFRLLVPKVGCFQKLLPLPSLRKRFHHFDGQHYWEIGKEGYDLKKVEADIKKTGFKIQETFRVFEMPYHRFFKLEVLK